MFDVFISYSSSDLEFVEKIEKDILQKDPSVKIFYAKSSLAEAGNSDYLDEIENAIRQSKNMMVFGSKAEKFIAKWVKHEWRFFQHLKLDSKGEGQYYNLFTVSRDVDITDLPDALRHCENININDTDKIYNYLKNVNQSQINKLQFQKNVDYLDSAFKSIGWDNTILVAPSLLSRYEDFITPNLKKVIILSHRLEEDAPGRALFNTVEKNLMEGIVYNYIIIKNPAAKSILRNIYFGHSERCRENIKMEICDFDFWVFGEYANITIYEYKNNHATEGFFRIKIMINEQNEQSVFLRISENIIRLIEGSIINCTEEGLIQKYVPKGE